MWRGKEPPSCPSDSNLLCASLLQQFTEHPATFHCFLCIPEERQIGLAALVLSTVAQVMLERAANGCGLALLPTPPLFSFPLCNALLTHRHHSYTATQFSTRIQNLVLNQFCSTPEKMQPSTAMGVLVCYVKRISCKCFHFLYIFHQTCSLL